MTDNADAQRSAWIKSDAKISPKGMQQKAEEGGFQFLWKMKLKNPARQLNSLTPPSTLERLIGYRGFRMLGFVGGSSDMVFTIDTDLGRLEWERKLSTVTPPPGTIACPGGMTTAVTRPTLTLMPSLTYSGMGAGRSNPAKSAVGKPGEGAVTLANVRPNPIGPPPSPAANAPRPRINPANPPGGQFGAGPFLIHALTGDGMFHSLHLSNGADYEPAIKFLPPGANASGLVVINQFAYATTDGACHGAANGVWALDIGEKKAMSWKANIAGAAGPGFDGEGTLFVATRGGGEAPNSIVALDPKTLTVKGAYSAGKAEFSSSPVVFEFKGKTLVAAAAKDGSIHVIEAANPAGGAVATSPAFAKGNDFMPGALASWSDPKGTRWLLAPTTGSQAADAGFPGSGSKGAVVAWKVVEENGKPVLQKGWASRDLDSPLAPTIINGVVFATSSGEFRTGDSKLTAAQRVLRSGRAAIYALDGTTGKELWSSGTTITSFARGNALSGGVGQIYLTTHDGMIYAFGFPMEH
jgi:outer membrane protein assembly factor BamB